MHFVILGFHFSRSFFIRYKNIEKNVTVLKIKNKFSYLTFYLLNARMMCCVV